MWTSLSSLRRLVGAFGPGATSVRLVSGAMFLSLLSRLVGLGRELAIVAWLGVHDYTDAYFATSAVVMWVQNAAFGALSLVLVPQFLRLDSAARTQWLRTHMLAAGVVGSIGGACVFGAFPVIQRVLLNGRVVFGVGEAALMASCVPPAAVGGILYASVIATRKGIASGAASLLIGNVFGVFVLCVAIGAGMRASYVLPAVLLGTQLATALVLFFARSKEPLRGSASEGGSPGRGIAAAMAENVGFNVNSLVHQGVAGRLPNGGVTLNAYAMRIILVPLTGLMGPIQQRLLQKYASATKVDSAALAYRVGALALLAGTGCGLAAIGLWAAARVVLPVGMRHGEFGWLILGYCAYAGVVFCNQNLARWYFSHGAGWLYAWTLIVGYALGTGTKGAMLSSLGLAALPAGSLIGEGTAALALLGLIAVTARREREGTGRRDAAASRQ